MKLKKYNKIQIELIKSSNISAESWILIYSTKFNQIVKSGISDIDKIQNLLYK